MWPSNIIFSRFHFPTRCALLCLFFVFLCAQETGCSPVAENAAASAPVSDANVTITVAAISQPETAANVEAASVSIEKERIPEALITNTGNISSNVRSALPVAKIFSCYTCRIIDKDDQHCTNVTECENVDKCHYIHGNVKISNEKSAKVTIAGCGHAPHTEISVHGHDLSVDIVHNAYDTCNAVNGPAKKIMKPNDIGNTTAVFEGHTCTCNSTACNARKTLFPASDTNVNEVKTAEAKGQSSSSAAVGANAAGVAALAYLLTFTNNVWKTV